MSKKEIKSFSLSDLAELAEDFTKDAIKDINIDKLIESSSKSLHRSRSPVERPTEEVSLQSVSEESTEYIKRQKDPTDDLVEIPCGCMEDEFNQFISTANDSYIIWCEDTCQTWFTHNKLCLDQNFIYREDLIIEPLAGNLSGAWEFYSNTGNKYDKFVNKKKTCRILDNPPNETYEVYYDSNYPMLKYGKATPTGSFIHKYDNRFHRDMAILELDKLYSDASRKAAAALTKYELGQKDAIIISDGAWLKERQASAFYYIDNISVVKQVEGRSPEDSEQAVLLSEINAALMALTMCYVKKKTQIAYYYDNTSIINVFRNKKQEYMETIKQYKDLLAKMHKEGYEVTFYELHPKSDDDKDNLNKALVYFHNSCDEACRQMAEICKKDYAGFISKTDEKQTYKDVEKLIPKPKQGGYKKGNYGNNSKKS